MMKTVNKLLLGAASVGLVMASPAMAARSKSAAKPAAATAPAAAAAAAPAAAATAVQWAVKTTYGKWGLLCNQANPSDCRAAQTQNYADEKNQGRLLQVLLAVENGRTFAVMTLPFGVDLRAGIALQLDSADEVKGAYTTCLPDGCQSVVELDEKLLGQFRTAKIMKVGFRPWGGDQKTFVVEVPLDGANDALAALKN